MSGGDIYISGQDQKSKDVHLSCRDMFILTGNGHIKILLGFFPEGFYKTAPERPKGGVKKN